MTTIEDNDPEYRIAYDVSQRKVGCILIQASLGGNVPRDLFFRYFNVDAWTVAVSGCLLYPIRQSQLLAFAARTSSDH
jgi:hypothetical protein